MHHEGIGAARVLAALLIGALLTPSTLAGEVPDEIVHFEIDYVTTGAHSVFILGDIPELGDADMTRAVKLAPISYQEDPEPHLIWAIDIAIPRGAAFTYQFVTRADSIAYLSDPNNGQPISSPIIAFTQAPEPPTRDVTLFARAAEDATEATFHTPTGDVLLPLRPVPQQPEILFARVPNQPNGGGINVTMLDKTYVNPLHAVYVRNGWQYNYVPATFNDPLGVKHTLVIPTETIAATRQIDGVWGRGVQVWTPRHYADHPDKHYPVLYMHDGQNVFRPGGPFGSWDAEIVAGRLLRDGLIRELIIVAIDNSSDRLREYNPDWDNSLNADYNSFVVRELKPHIDATFRTLPQREDTAVVGSSFGGIASIALGVEFPEVFGRVGGMSTSFWATGLGPRLADGELPDDTRLYLDAGDISDGAEYSVAVRDALLAGGRVLEQNLFFQIGYGHEHNEAAWNSRLPEALEAFFPVDDEPTDLDLPLPVPADLDADCDVDFDDLNRFLAAYGGCAGEAGYDALADLDGSGCVGWDDLNILLAAYGETGCD